MPISSQKILTHSLYGFTATDSKSISHQADLAQYSMEFVKDNCSRILLWLSAYTAQYLWKVFGFYNCGIECVCWVSLQGPWESCSIGEKKDRPLDLDNWNEWVFKFSVFQWCAQKWNQTCIYTAHASYDISVWAHIYQAAGWKHGNLHRQLCSVMGQVLHFQEVGLLLLLSQLIVSLIYPLQKLHQQINLCVFIPCLVMSHSTLL